MTAAHVAQGRQTASMLQRIPVILAVTAASYGLQVPPVVQRMQQQSSASQASGEGPALKLGGPRR